LDQNVNEKADEIKKRYQYRRLILKRKISLNQKTATKLIGPDTAYHLYCACPLPTTTSMNGPDWNASSRS